MSNLRKVEKCERKIGEIVKPCHSIFILSLCFDSSGSDGMFDDPKALLLNVRAHCSILCLMSSLYRPT